MYTRVVRSFCDFYLLFIFILLLHHLFVFFFFFNDTATTEIYTLSLHDALPILTKWRIVVTVREQNLKHLETWLDPDARSEEHTSELQSHSDLVCRLLLEKKKKKNNHKKIKQTERNIVS